MRRHRDVNNRGGVHQGLYVRHPVVGNLTERVKDHLLSFRFMLPPILLLSKAAISALRILGTWI